MAAGLFFVALTTLMLELTLIRVFDVIWYPNLAYMIITLAMFCFALSGVYASLRPRPHVDQVGAYVARLAILFGIFALAILPLLNAIPFNFDVFLESRWQGIFWFTVVYGILAVPFFLSGLIFTTVFATFADRIQMLYCWDLVGAGIGCLILIPLLPLIGPGGMLFLACAFGLWASALFSGNRNWLRISAVVGLCVVVVPFARTDGYYDFKEQIMKRGVKAMRLLGWLEHTYWDPISKIDVADFTARKEIYYDGGTQISVIVPLDRPPKQLRKVIPDQWQAHFSHPGVLASHALKRDTEQEVLVIGSAGGQEVKAALVYGAARIDAVELVGHVVHLGKEAYADYNGNYYNHPNVNYRVGEGRSFLRATNNFYDIIQIFSNHTSSSIAAGSGALAPTYLQTAEAYIEYFTHLRDDGILHINHHVYPRMLSTAALAWKRLGRTNFRRHVAVFESGAQVQDNLPTVLIKMSPWTKKELRKIGRILGAGSKLVENPLQPESSFLPDEFYTGQFPPELAHDIPYRAGPLTDDKPFFNFLRKDFDTLEVDSARHVNVSTAGLLNSQVIEGFVPRDVLHLVVTAGASMLFTAIFVLIPLWYSNAGRTRWMGRPSAIIYFACLGAGFIIIELIFIQLFMRLIGYPLYTYSTVVFAVAAVRGYRQFRRAPAGGQPRQALVVAVRGNRGSGRGRC